MNLTAAGHAAAVSGRPIRWFQRESTLGDSLISYSYNLRAVRAYLLKEDFQFFWNYVSTYWARTFLDRWCARTMRSRIEPLKKGARTLRQHRPISFLISKNPPMSGYGCSSPQEFFKFKGKIPAELLQEGRANEVIAVIDQLRDGVFI